MHLNGANLEKLDQTQKASREEKKRLHEQDIFLPRLALGLAAGGWDSWDCWDEEESAIDILLMKAWNPEMDEEKMKIGRNLGKSLKIARKLENALNIGRNTGEKLKIAEDTPKNSPRN